MTESVEPELQLAPMPPEPSAPTTPSGSRAGTDHDDADGGPRFRLLVVPGVVPASWLRTWKDRLPGVPVELVHTEVAGQHAALTEDRADAALLRLPVDRDALSAIPLYVETTVVVLPKDHLLTALDEVTPEDLAEETMLVPADDVLGWADPPGEPSALPTPATTAEAVELVASGVGLLAVPQSLARLHHRRDLTYRTLTGAPASQVALAWSSARDGDPLVEEMIGIVRGRTANSSRGIAATGAAGAGASGTAPARTGEAPARGKAAGKSAPTPPGKGAARSDGRRGGPSRSPRAAGGSGGAGSGRASGGGRRRGR
ncbi:MAG TPA: LysR family substrate-binding domain-containing protein [Cellulomonas sp.]